MGIQVKIMDLLAALSPPQFNHPLVIGVSKKGMEQLVGAKSSIKEARFNFVAKGFVVRRIGGLAGEAVALIF